MKGNRWVYIFLFVLLITCKKKDYREMYVGTYSCEHPNGSYNLNVEIAEGDHSIKIGSANAILDEDGSFSVHISSTFYGHFSCDSLYLGNSSNTVCVKID